MQPRASAAFPHTRVTCAITGFASSSSRCHLVKDNVGGHVFPFQSSLSSVALIGSNRVMLFGQHIPGLSKYFIPCHPLAIVPSILPVTTRFSNPLLLTTCPKNSVLVIPDCFFSVHEIFSILLKNHISVACSFFCTVFEIVHASHPCNKTDQT